MDFQEKNFTKIQLLQVSIILLAILGVTANLWGFKVYAFGWHFLNANPFVWEDIKITVPDELVVREVKNNNNKKLIKLVNNDKNTHVTIFFAKLINATKSYPLKTIYKKMNFELIAEKPCQIFDHPCQWVVGKYQEDDAEKYREDIFLKSQKLWISFLGPKDKRFYLEQVTSSLQN